MICYKDMTFCTYYETCKDGLDCIRALTLQVEEDARKWWGENGAPICRYAERPECYK